MATKGLSPTQRTLRELRNQGVVCDICEKWNPFAGPFGKRSDLFGFIDLIALDPVKGIVAIQCCGIGAHSGHKKKILEERNQEAHEWLRCGGKIEIWSWSLRKVKRGGKAVRWTARVEEITRDMLEE